MFLLLETLIIQITPFSKVYPEFEGEGSMHLLPWGP